MTMVTTVTSVSFSHLKVSLGWRTHTYEVLLASQGLLVDVIDVQRGMRGYVLTGKWEELDAYQRGVTDGTQQVAKLTHLTRDNPAQEQRLRRLESEVTQMLDYSRRLLAATDAQGLQSAIEVEATGAGRVVTDMVLADLQAFTQEEQRLLVERLLMIY